MKVEEDTIMKEEKCRWDISIDIVKIEGPLHFITKFSLRKIIEANHIPEQGERFDLGVLEDHFDGIMHPFRIKMAIFGTSVWEGKPYYMVRCNDIMCDTAKKVASYTKELMDNGFTDSTEIVIVKHEVKENVRVDN